MGAQERFPLEWIDEYVANLRDFVVVRETDSLLIKVPNEAYRLNASGVRTMRYMLGGGSVLKLWRTAGGTDAVRRDIYTFFISLKQTLQGCLNERRLPGAIEVRPFALGFSTLPILSEVALTYRCNLACQFCYAGCTCSRRDAGGGEMTTEEAKRILRIIAEDAEVPSVSFTGGEPTLREDLEELVAYARAELRLRVNLIT
ncbi:MAG: radical SAM protein, partial [Planctomycetota bacterium]